MTGTQGVGLSLWKIKELGHLLKPLVPSVIAQTWIEAMGGGKGTGVEGMCFQRERTLSKRMWCPLGYSPEEFEFVDLS